LLLVSCHVSNDVRLRRIFFFQQGAPEGMHDRALYHKHFGKPRTPFSFKVSMHWSPSVSGQVYELYFVKRYYEAL